MGAFSVDFARICLAFYDCTDPADNIKPDKEKSTEHIDGSIATIMALERALRKA